MALRQQGPDPNVLAATRMYVRQLGNCTSIDAPAKLNLSLEILGRRDDGYHDLETLMVCVSVCDTLEFTPTADGRISLACRWADGYAARAGGVCGDLPTGPDNLVWRAVSLVRERAGIGAGADIRLTKAISVSKVGWSGRWEFMKSPLALAQSIPRQNSEIAENRAGSDGTPAQVRKSATCYH
jgi:hypothetical protein